MKSEIPYNIDLDITEHRGQSLLDDSLSRYPQLPIYTDQASHIHLAACGSQEKAWENENRGAFTSALLNTIRAYGADKVTYRNLVTSLPALPKQVTELLFTISTNRLPDNHPIATEQTSLGFSSTHSSLPGRLNLFLYTAQVTRGSFKRARPQVLPLARYGSYTIHQPRIRNQLIHCARKLHA